MVKGCIEEKVQIDSKPLCVCVCVIYVVKLLWELIVMEVKELEEFGPKGREKQGPNKSFCCEGCQVERNC